MIKKLLFTKFSIIIFLLFAFSVNVNAQCTATITTTTNTSTLACGTSPLNCIGGIIYIGDGTTPMSLGMDANLDLSCLGAIRFIVRKNAKLDFAAGSNKNLTLGAGSSIEFDPGSDITPDASCSASDLIKIGSVKVASCNGGSAITGFPTLVSNGGYNPNCPTYSLTGASATTACAAMGTSTVTLASSVGLPVGTYTVTYDTSAPAQSGLTATMTVSTAGTGTFTATGLISAGPSTVTVKKLASGSCFNSINSNGTATVTVNPNLPTSVNILASPSAAICAGSSVTFTATPTNEGTTPTYQWKLNGTNVGTNSTTYTNSSMVNGDVVSCVMTSNAACVKGSPATSNAVKMVVNTLPDNTATGFSSSSFCIGNQATITFNANNGLGKLPYTLYYINNTNPSIIYQQTINTYSEIAFNLVPNPTVTTNYTLQSIKDDNGCINYFAKDITAEVTIVPLPSTPTIGVVTQPACNASTGSFTIDNYNASYTYTVSPSAGVMVSGNTVTAPTGSYTVTATLGTCTSDASASVPISGQLTNIWNGSAWSDVSPPPATGGTQNIVFNGGFTANTDLSGCSCEVKSGDVTIASGKTMTITNGVKVSGGQLIFENNASLVQINEDPNINSGNITYKRYTTKVKRYDFTYWSSPVAEQKLFDLSPNTLYDKYYGYNPATGWILYYNGNAKMEVGKGYIVRAPQNFSITNAVIDTAPQFIGVPNNGVKQITIGPASDYLLGNPYPSAIDADRFLRDNTGTSGALEGTLYFWTHNSPPSDAVAGSATYNYTSNDYASYNLTGGVITTSVAAKTDSDPNRQPSGKIAAGQAFFAKSSASGGTVTFDNRMRQIAGASIDNSQFFKMKNSKGESANAIEKNRIWLNLTSNQGAFKQLLLGYISGATNGYEGVFDGESYDGNGFVDFYTINEDKNLTIQGRALPFNENDVVPIGFRSTIEGLFTINIDEVDGLFTSQGFFLEDKKTNSIKNLKEGGYTFATGSGTFNDRFVLRFINASKTLGTGTFELNDNAVVIAKDKNELKIKSQQENIKRITVFDLLGRKVFDKDSINNNEFCTSNIDLNNQTVVVKVTLTNGKVISKKVIY